MKNLLPSLAIVAALGAQPTSPTWLQFLEDAKAGRPSHLPDYSFAGYRMGTEGIPEVMGKIFNVVDYGARPNDEVEDQDAIQKAIVAAEGAGGGIVFFPPGRFLLNEKPGQNKFIVIPASNIVLRGSGAGEGGTELFMRHYLMPEDPNKKWTVPKMFTFRLAKRAPEGVLGKVVQDAKRDGFSIELDQASAVRVGSLVTLNLGNPEANDEFLQGQAPWPKWTTTVQKGVQVSEKHRVVSVKGNLVTFGEPLRTAVTAKWGWELRSFSASPGWGVEDLWFRGNFQEEMVHHKNFIHDAGWGAFRVERGVDFFMRRMRFTDICEGVNLSGSFGASALMIRFDGNRGHGTLSAGGGNGVLLGLIHDAARQGMWHGPCFAGSQAGGVVWRYKGQEKSGADFHASWPYCNLWDLCESGLIGNGGNVDLLPNHLADLTWWNQKEVGTPRTNYDFWDPQPEDKAVQYTGVKIVKPNIYGWHGAGSTFVREHVGRLESEGTLQAPESLYEAQLERRLGKTPAWVPEAKKSWSNYLATGNFPPPPAHRPVK